jgi:prepilin-type N-terminal cleavage/methylation domain-containing protein/prepilin-type processing-associated H-X9-DG protein
MTTIQRKGFTLIELLVVIAIIALLMSILMPALRNVRDQAKDAMCKQRLQQWGVLYNMYADDNNGTLMDFTMINGIEYDHAWVYLMKSYIGDWEICRCPATIYTWGDGGNYQDPLMGWDFQIIGDVVDDGYEAMFTINNQWAYGSYGKNAFVTNGDAFPATRFASEHSWMYEYCYKNIRVQGVSRISLFGDSQWMGGWPSVYTEPAPTREHGPDGGDILNQWNLDRHNMSVNMLFLDWSVRKVGLRQLWSLKWSKQTVADENGINVPAWGNLSVVPDWNDPLQWPEWMRNSKNYGL